MVLFKIRPNPKGAASKSSVIKIKDGHRVLEELDLNKRAREL